MRLSYKWLLELTGCDWPVDMVAERLTQCGTACEYVERADQFMDRVVVGRVEAVRPVEGASKIKLTTVNLGNSSMDIICGAPNVEEGQKVPVALEGARLAGDMVIKKMKIRGIESTAMICSERELGISDDHSGIMVLESDAPVGKPLAEYLEYDDYILTFELTPNRADSLSAFGIARDLAALASLRLIRPPLDLEEPTQKAADCVRVTIDDPVGCPRYAARVVKNVRIGPSPWWLQKKLLMSGIRPISNIVDITNFVMLETGHPLHAFDLNRFGSDEVVVRRARDKERFATLDGKEHELSSEVLMITNGKNGVAVGGVMGGLDSEVENTTTDILLEAAYFNPQVIRHGRKQLGMVTESSSRFEKGADPNVIPYAIDRAASLMQQLCGGNILAGIVDCYPRRIEPKKVKLRPPRCNAILGTAISTGRMKQILNYLEFTVSGDDMFEVTVPTFRPDVTREIDLIEEIARIEGYETIPNAVENVGPLFTPVHFDDKFRNDTRQVLTASGFDEMIHHGLVDARQAALIGADKAMVKVVNPVSEDLGVMRTTLIQTVLNAVAHNISHRNLDLCLFEIGNIFYPAGNSRDWGEEERLVLAVTGSTEHTWRDSPRPLDFYDVTGAIGRLASHFGWGKVEYEPEAAAYFDGDVSFAVMIDGKRVGQAGKMRGDLAGRFEIKQVVYVAELELKPLMSISGSLKKYQPVPVYPAAPRDLAIIVDEQTRAGDLISAVRESAGELAETVEIFDLYRGKQIEKGKKSVAISVNYRSRTGNLSSEQVDERQSAVIKVLQKKFKAQIRDK